MKRGEDNEKFEINFQRARPVHALCTPCAFTERGHPAVCKHTPPCYLTPPPTPLKQVLIKNVVAASLKKFVNQAANDARRWREGEREKGGRRRGSRVARSWGKTVSCPNVGHVPCLMDLPLLFSLIKTHYLHLSHSPKRGIERESERETERGRQFNAGDGP